MIKEHPAFEPPSDPLSPIWRYMDFTKFVAMLENRALYFCTPDKFNDPFEGSYPSYNVKLRPQIYGGENGIPEEGLKQFSEISRLFIGYTAINCWHLNRHESAAMWRLYLKSNEGIAIQSTYSRLRDSIQAASEDVYIGMVHYIDYESEWMPEGNLLYPFAHKRKSFSHEQELRALTCKFPGPPNDRVPPFDGGLNIKIDLNTLIENIYIAPGSPAWLIKLVEAVARKYSMLCPIFTSKLEDKPVY